MQIAMTKSKCATKKNRAFIIKIVRMIKDTSMFVLDFSVLL